MTDFRLDILEQILKLRLGIAQRDNARVFELLSQIYPLRLYRYESGRDHNGWVVPDHWDVEKCEIRKDGKLLFDGTQHPLAVCGASTSFKGSLSKAELDQHVFNSKKYPDEYLYVPLNCLRPWQERWAVSVPISTYRTWGEGTYEIDLQTSFHCHEMLAADCFYQGRSAETIVFNAHTCHPCQANDGYSGIMVMLQLFKWLQGRDTRYSYLGVLAPEQIGSVYYVANMPKEHIANIKLGVFLESVGTDSPLSLQKSFTGRTIIDEIAEYALRRVQPQLRVGAFRTIAGNDETTWEAPGVEVPMVSVTRHPFNEYHTTADNVRAQSQARLEEAFGICKQIVTVLEDDRTMQRKFDGLVALSNPRFDLYRQRANPTIDNNYSDEDMRWGVLQDYLPRYFDGKHSIFEIARKHDVDFSELRTLMDKFEERGLVGLHEIASAAVYKDLARLDERTL